MIDTAFQWSDLGSYSYDVNYVNKSCLHLKTLIIKRVLILKMSTFKGFTLNISRNVNKLVPRRLNVLY